MGDIARRLCGTRIRRRKRQAAGGDDNRIGNGGVIQASAFNYTSSPNLVNLQPSKSNSTIITLNIKEDAPVGQYSMYINLEASITATPAPNSYFSTDESYWFSMIITPS